MRQLNGMLFLGPNLEDETPYVSEADRKLQEKIAAKVKTQLEAKVNLQKVWKRLRSFICYST